MPCQSIVRMTKIPVLLLAAALARAQEPPAGEKDRQPGAGVPQLQVLPYGGGYLGAGAAFSNTTGNPDRLAEYESLRQGTRATGRFSAWGYAAGTAYDIESRQGVDPNDRLVAVRADFARYWVSEFRYSRLLHRLENDPLTNQDAAMGTVVVRHDNYDRGIRYCPYRQDMEWSNRLTLPDLPQLSFTFDYRDQQRKGTTQARATSKCANCHTNSHVREMDQDIREWRAGANLVFERASLRYRYSERDARDRAPVVTNLYDEAQHPQTLQQIFTNRVQYDRDDGPLPIAVVPHFRKRQHSLKGDVDLARYGRLQVTFLKARSENLDRAYGHDTRVASGVYTVDLGGKARLILRARNLEIDSDSLFVDVAEPVANAGPQLGKTFAQSYPSWGTADYEAHSAEARKVFTGGIDGRIVLPRRTTFRFGYEYESLERPWFEVKETNTQRLRLSINSRSWKELAVRAGCTYTRSDFPFTHVKAALTPEIQPTASPGSPPSPLLGTQYFTLYDRRQANLSNFPADSHRTFASAPWTPGDWFALSAHLRAYRDRNDKLNYAPWSDSAVASSAEAWIALSPRVDLTAGYAPAHRTTDTLFVIPMFDG